MFKSLTLIGTLVTAIVTQYSYAEEKKPLFIRLGGKPGVTKIAEVLVDTLSADTRLLKNPAIQEIIKKNNAAKLKASLYEHICTVTSGPCKAKGPLIVGVPIGFKLGFWEWMYFLQNINSTLDKCSVSKTEKFEIVTLVTQMKSKYASAK